MLFYPNMVKTKLTRYSKALNHLLKKSKAEKEQKERKLIGFDTKDAVKL